MKKLSFFLLSLLFVVGTYGQANALVFTLGSYDVTLNTVDPGLVLHSSNILPMPTNFDLALGSSITVDLFKIWTDESAINNGEDTVSKPIDVGLNFTAPAPSFGGSVEGDTMGILGGFMGSYQAGQVVWDGPVTIGFGGGGELVASLSDELFNEGYFWGTGCKGAIVELTLTYQTAPVPEPSTMLLLGAGLAGLAGVTWRRRKNG